MSLPVAIALYFICWWLVLFAVLPVGVRSQHEHGEIAPGTEEGAPVAARLILKMIATTLISGVLFAAFYLAVDQGYLDLDKIPFLPRYEQSF